MTEKLTCYNADTGGNVVNDVQLAYNDFGQLVTECQAHEGSVDTSTTPKVQYTYPDGSAGHIRLQKVTYPNGRVLRFEFNSGLDDSMNRVSYLADDDNGSPGTHLADYSYLGSGSIVRVDYTEPQVRYDLAHGIGNDPYDGVDRFGRVVDLLWRNYNTSTDVVRIKHGYDRAGNRLWREDPVAASNGKSIDELYSYDGMYQLTSMQRGNLNANKDGLITNTKTFAEDWTLDPNGNWSTFKQDTDGDGTWDVNQSRTHNKANEITQIAGASTHVGHDAAGNATRTPKPDDWADHFDLTYDAWNRLVKVEDNGTTVAEYEYDPRNFRTVKLSYESGILQEVRHFYFNAAWQCVEERVEASADSSSSGASGTATTDRQFVWGQRYIDDLILRDRDTNSQTGNLGKSGSGLDERLYAMQDPNWNVAGIADSDGNVVERYTHQAYGERSVLSGMFGSRASSSYAWRHGYTGRSVDNETGHLYFRNRRHHPSLGRFGRRDPALRPGRDRNAYCFVDARPLHSTDPFGNTVYTSPPKDKIFFDQLIGAKVTRNRSGHEDFYMFAARLDKMLDWGLGPKEARTPCFDVEVKYITHETGGPSHPVQFINDAAATPGDINIYIGHSNVGLDIAKFRQPFVDSLFKPDPDCGQKFSFYGCMAGDYMDAIDKEYRLQGYFATRDVTFASEMMRDFNRQYLSIARDLFHMCLCKYVHGRKAKVKIYFGDIDPKDRKMVTGLVGPRGSVVLQRRVMAICSE